MKHVFRSNEVAHKWASQSQDSGRNSQGNFYFEGKSIYSYGSHFEIARFVKPNVTLHTPRSYSVTTAKHKRLAWAAVSHTRRYEVPELDNPIGNVGYLDVQIRNALDTLKKSRSSIQYRFQDVVEKIETLREFTKEFKIRSPQATAWYRRRNSFISKKELAKLNATAEKVKAGNDKASQTRKANRAKAWNESRLVYEAWDTWGDTVDALNLEAWRNNDPRTPRLGYNVPYAIRLEGNEIVTTHGARVPRIEAENLWYHLQHFKSFPEGYTIGGYKVTGVHDGKLIVGCHRIPVTDIARMARLLKLEGSLI